MSTFPFESLRRLPDFESPELLASDAADRLLLSELKHEVEADPSLLEAGLVVIGDSYGAITLAAIADLGFTSVRVHQDARSGELALDNNAKELSITGFTHHDLDKELVSGARIVAMRLPRSLDQLDQWSSLIAAYAAPNVQVFAGGRLKHMTLGMNDVLKQYFGMVVASLAVQKSRVLRVKEPMSDVALEALSTWPKSKRYDVIDMTVCAHGGVFAGINLDIGTRELLAVLDQTPTDAKRIIDFGCGSGLLAVAISRLRPGATVIASDQSSAAVASAKATLEANGLGGAVEVVRDDGLSSQADASADVILFNPPFHSGAAVHSDTSVRLFAEAGRVLKPGGELWVVANSHLGYKPILNNLVGETKEIRRTPKFTVTSSTKA
ncbi:class I SAM-dependent methyltransferase [uncultured Aurantimicrobium sp.]|uniref:class I SAM-dependent methyltransferase n=1 Tax=uncultured Aurantimicrobium sp. TaxID=1705357 RepID=UPI0026085A0B|nr:methyltransferase [uncultured Aurantimicrobium sp.]